MNNFFKCKLLQPNAILVDSKFTTVDDSILVTTAIAQCATLLTPHLSTDMKHYLFNELMWKFVMDRVIFYADKLYHVDDKKAQHLNYTVAVQNKISQVLFSVIAGINNHRYCLLRL